MVSALYFGSSYTGLLLARVIVFSSSEQNSSLSKCFFTQVYDWKQVKLIMGLPVMNTTHPRESRNTAR